MNENVNTKVIVPARLSYVHVWEPTSNVDNTEKKYSVSLIIPKSDKESLAKIKKTLEAAIELGVQTKFNGKKPANLKLPVRDGDTERSEDEAYKDSYFINASAKTKPGVLNPDKTIMTKEDDLYSGCYAWVSLTLFPFAAHGTNGIASGLNNLMKIKDGEPLGGRSTAESDFADIPGAENDPLGSIVEEDNPLF